MNNYMDFVLLFLHLLLWWTCVLDSDGKLYFSLLHNIYYFYKMCEQWQKTCFSLHLLLFWTCALTAWCSACKLLSLLPNIHSLWQVVWWMTNFEILFLHLLLWWNYAFAYAQAAVSYFSLLHSVCQDVSTITWTLVFFFSTCYFHELVC